VLGVYVSIDLLAAADIGESYVKPGGRSRLPNP
jgi:hypothetical protein